MLRRIGKALGIGLTWFALQGNVKAEEPINLKTAAYFQKGEDPSAQTWLSRGKNRLFLQTDGDNSLVGINAENKNFRVNVGRDDASDNSRLTAELKGSKGSVGVEYQDLAGEDRFGIYGRYNINGVDVEITADQDENARGVVFFPTGETSMAGIGGGVSGNGYWEANGTWSTQITERYGMGAHLRVGENNFADARVRLGPNVGWQKARAFGIGDGCYNSISVVGDVTDPAGFNGFSYFGSEACTGTQTGDIGLDVGYTEGSKAYGNVSVNAGDYWNLEDAVITAGYTRDLENDSDKVKAGIGTTVGGVQIQYQVTHDIETEETNQEGLVTFSF